MKLVRYGAVGKEKPGLIDAAGKLRDLSKRVKDFDGEGLSPTALSKLLKIKTESLPPVKGKPRMGCPVANVRKFIAIGLNFYDHAEESGMPRTQRARRLHESYVLPTGRQRPCDATQGLG